MKFDPKKHLFVFTHIPKCGGTSVHDCLKSMLKEKYVAITPDTPMDHIDKHIWGIGGHFNFGGVYPWILDGRRPIYMTILRHPWSRFVSYFHHVAFKPDHPIHKCVSQSIKINPIKIFSKHFCNRFTSLFNRITGRYEQNVYNCASYIKEIKPIEVFHLWKSLGDRNINNLQTQMICNKDPEDATTKEAINIIQHHYKFISTLDHLDEVMDEVAAFFDIKRQPIGKLNVGIQQNIINLGDDNLYNEVIEWNHRDLLLYQHVASKFK